MDLIVSSVAGLFAIISIIALVFSVIAYQESRVHSPNDGECSKFENGICVDTIHNLTDEGTVMECLRIKAEAADGRVLTSDAVGKATWKEIPGPIFAPVYGAVYQATSGYQLTDSDLSTDWSGIGVPLDLPGLTTSINTVEALLGGVTYDITTGAFTVPEDGLYHMAYNILIENGGLTNAYATLGVNTVTVGTGNGVISPNLVGGQLVFDDGAVGHNGAAAGSGVKQLNAGDTVRLLMGAIGGGGPYDQGIGARMTVTKLM